MTAPIRDDGVIVILGVSCGRRLRTASELCRGLSVGLLRLDESARRQRQLASQR